MSIVSKFLNKKFGVPEVDLKKVPLVKDVVAEIIKNGTSEVFKSFSTSDLMFLVAALENEIEKRK